MTIRLSHTTTVPDGELAVELNDVRPGHPFATIDLDDFGRTYLVVHTPGDADRLITAIVTAKNLLLGAQVLLSPGPDPAAIIAKAIEDGTAVIVEDDDEPRQAKGPESWCAATQGDGDFAVVCNSQPGHDGPVHVAWAADGSVVACWTVTVTASAGAS